MRSVDIGKMIASLSDHSQAQMMVRALKELSGMGCVEAEMLPFIDRSIDHLSFPFGPFTRHSELAIHNGFLEHLEGLSLSREDWQYMYDKYYPYFASPSTYSKSWINRYEEHLALCGVNDPIKFFAIMLDKQWMSLWENSDDIESVANPTTFAFNERDAVYLAARALRLATEDVDLGRYERLVRDAMQQLMAIEEWSIGEREEVPFYEPSRGSAIRNYVSQIARYQETVVYQDADEDEPFEALGPLLSVPIFPGFSSENSEDPFGSMSPLVVFNEYDYTDLWADLIANLYNLGVVSLSGRNVEGAVKCALMILTIMDRRVIERYEIPFLDSRIASKMIMEKWREIFPDPSLLGTVELWEP